MTGWGRWGLDNFTQELEGWVWEPATRTVAPSAIRRSLGEMPSFTSEGRGKLCSQDEGLSGGGTDHPERGASPVSRRGAQESVFSYLGPPNTPMSFTCGQALHCP